MTRLEGRCSGGHNTKTGGLDLAAGLVFDMCSKQNELLALEVQKEPTANVFVPGVQLQSSVTLAFWGFNVISKLYL